MEPQVIENGKTGERIEHIESGEDEEGEYVKVETSLPAGSDGPPLHIHPNQDESFETIDGKLGLRIGDEEHVLEPGESMTVTKGTPHTWWNAGTTTVAAVTEIRPPLRLLEQGASGFGLFNSGKMFIGNTSIPNPFQLAVFFGEFRDELELVMPRFAEVLIYRLFEPIGHALGYQAAHEYVPPAVSSEITQSG